MSTSSIIDIVNFLDYDVVSYSLILIKGIVRCDSLNETDIANVNCLCNNEANDWPIINCNFRSLAVLKEGINELTFNYRDSSKTISIDFRKRLSSFFVFPVYFVFKNEKLSSECDDNSSETTCARISFCAKLVQCFYAEKLYENGYGHKTFQLIEDISDCHSGCYLFQSKMCLEEAGSLSPDILWETLGREIMNSEIGNSRYKYLGITSSSCADSEGTKMIEVALGSGGLALIDSLPVFTWPSSVNQVIPCFTDRTLLNPPLSFNVWYRGTRGGCCSASIGSLCHELGHTFDLGHPNSGIMSTDFHLFHNAFLPVTTNQFNQTTFDLHFVPDITTVHSSSCITKLKKTSSSAKQANKIIDNSRFTTGCTTILSHHKWFNDNNKTFKIEFDRDRVILQSEAGLKVVQLRGENGKVIKSWEMSGEKTEHMVLPRLHSCLTVFSMDNYGNISVFPYNDQVPQ